MKSTTTTKTLPFALYGRVSRKNGRDGEGYISPDVQLETDMRIAATHNLPYVDGEFFLDEDVSGGTFVRAEFDRALALVKAKKRAGMIVPYFSRFTRADTGSALAMIAELESAGGMLYDETGKVTLATATDELMTTVKAAFARMERRQRADGLAGAVERSILNGKHLIAPFGYAKEKSSKLIVFAPEAAVVRLIFELRAEGWSWSKIAERANATHVLPRPRKRDKILQQARWTPQTVSQLTRNPVYKGTAWNGEHELPGAHEAIVSHELFAKVEELRGAKPKRRDGESSEGALLSGGLVRCSGCGHAAVYQEVAGRPYYRCRFSQISKGSCRAPLNVNAEQLEDYVVSLFKEKALGRVEFDELAGGAAVAEAERARDEAIAMVEAIAAQIKPGQSAATTRVLERRLAEADREVAVSAERLAAAQMAARGLQLPPELDESMFDDAPISDRRQWIASVFESAVVRPAAVWRELVPDRVTVLRKGEAPVGSTTELIGWIASRTW